MEGAAARSGILPRCMSDLLVSSPPTQGAAVESATKEGRTPRAAAPFIGFLEDPVRMISTTRAPGERERQHHQHGPADVLLGAGES